MAAKRNGVSWELGLSTSKTAMSVEGSVPTTSAEDSLPSENCTRTEAFCQ